MTKRFKDSLKVWMGHARLLIKAGNAPGATALVQQALKSLPSHKHIKALTQLAQMEFAIGDVERGRTLFEGILSDHPKRLDIWNIYIDAEVKKRNENDARRLFNRLVNLKMSTKKMKFNFKKWHQFEVEFGGEERAEEVLQKAREYVSRL